MYKVTVFLADGSGAVVEGVKDYNIGQGFLEVSIGDKNTEYFNIDKIVKFAVKLENN